MKDWEQTISLIAASGTLGALIDFLIGKAGQKKALDTLATWWIKLDAVSVRTFAKAEAEFAAKILTRVLGGTFTRRRLVALSLITATATIPWFFGALFSDEPFPQTSAEDNIFAFVLFIFTALQFWLSLSLTIFFARIICRVLIGSVLKNSALYLAMVALQTALLLIVSDTNFFIYSYVTDFIEGIDSHSSYMSWINGWADGGFSRVMLTSCDFSSPSWATYVGVIYSITPGGIRLFIALIFLLSLFFRPIYMTILLFVRRLAELDNHVFAVAAGGIAALAKSLKFLMAYYSG